MDKVKKLTLTPARGTEKNKKQKGPRVAKKRNKAATINLVSARFFTNLPDSGRRDNFSNEANLSTDELIASPPSL